jgi:hypothetical protein
LFERTTFEYTPLLSSINDDAVIMKNRPETGRLPLLLKLN